MSLDELYEDELQNLKDQVSLQRDQLNDEKYGDQVSQIDYSVKEAAKRRVNVKQLNKILIDGLVPLADTKMEIDVSSKEGLDMALGFFEGIHNLNDAE